MQEIILQGQQLVMHPYKGVFWADRRILLLADLHLGKVAHFRREGLAVPPAVDDTNWDRLLSLLLEFKPERVLFLGDLFHSDYTRDWEELGAIVRQFAPVGFGLIPGNHDQLTDYAYRSAAIEVLEPHHFLGPFVLTHHPQQRIPEGYYNLAGHVHPAVRLRGFGRQRLRLPCFYFGAQCGILPAFGAFTGLGDLRICEGDRVYVVTAEEVIGM